MTEDEMVGWHHRLNGHEFEQTPGGSEGQERLAFCSPWGHKELDTTERLNNNKTSLNSKELFSTPQTKVDPAQRVRGLTFCHQGSHPSPSLGLTLILFAQQPGSCLGEMVQRLRNPQLTFQLPCVFCPLSLSLEASSP